MQLLDEGPVLDSEIDSLGHMNVRFYLERVDRANRALLNRVGLTANIEPGVVLRRQDTYSRFRREQFAGAELQVVGGMIELNARAARCYFEIRNPAKDQVAASFITASTLVNHDTQAAGFFPEMPIDPGYLVTVPQAGAPRSLNLNPPNLDVSLAELNQRVSANPPAGMMSGRRDAVILPEDCNDNGRLREGVDMMFVMHRPQPGENLASFGPPVLKTDEGHRFSWAMIETRAVVLALPMANDRIVSIGADVALGDRWRQSRRWAFVEATGELIGVNDTLGMALDLDERRSIDIPARMREEIEASYLPDLA